MKQLMVINRFMTMNPQTKQIWIKIEQKKGGYYRRFYAEWNTRERFVQEL